MEYLENRLSTYPHYVFIAVQIANLKKLTALSEKAVSLSIVTTVHTVKFEHGLLHP